MSLLFRSALLCFAVAAPLEGQARMVLPASSAPTCAQQGITRVALSVPPDRTREELTASLQAGKIFPGGTEAYLFPDGAGPRVLNAEHLRGRSNRTLQRILHTMKVEGAVAVLLTIDETGKVTKTLPNSGNPALDKLLDRYWREAQFEPVVVGGCRPPVMFHMPVYFESDYSLARRNIQMRWGTLPAPPPGR